MFLLVFMHLAHVVLLLVVVVLDVLLVFMSEHCATVVHHHHTLTDIHAHICNHFSIDSI